MREFLRRRLEPLTRDDLFVRVLSALIGLVAGGIGVAMVVAAASREFIGWLGWFNLVWWPIALLLIFWGALLIARCAVSARSHIARLAEKTVPDPPMPDEATILVLIFVVPAALLTLLLRLVGVSGQALPNDGTTLFR